MPETVLKFLLSYDALNEDNTFTSGDYVKGRVGLLLGKEAKIDNLFIKMKGEAKVQWSEGSGDGSRTYKGHERFFKFKTMFISNEAENRPTTVDPGAYIFPFCFKIPEGLLPSSFEGKNGYIRYILEAKMNRPWKMTKNTSAKLNFIPKLYGDTSLLLSPQSGEKHKKMNMFSSGSLSFKAHLEKIGYMLGERLIVQAVIENASSRDLKPKYKLNRKITYIVKSSTKIERDTIFKEVYIDVPYAFDPEIKFPLYILPASGHGSSVSGVPAPFGNKSHLNDHAPQPGAVGPQQPQPMPANPGVDPPAFYSPAAAAAADPGPAFPPSMQPNPTYQLPPLQYDQAHPVSTAPPLYPTIVPTTDFLSTPSAPQYVPGAVDSDFLTSTSVPQQYPGPAAAPSFLSSPGSTSDPGYDLPTYEMVFPNAQKSGSTPNSTV